MPPDVHFPLSSKDRCHGPSARIDAPWAEGALPQRTGTDRNDAPARDTYAKAPDPSPGHLCNIETAGDTMRVLSRAVV